ncbi:putative E3 ubiquitin-protein ligase LIN-2 [Mercurialis annua]|uniref:putative E3 ubiquitin-protein ligase LIN-2 n=1 Tax=Mercurialis annua TaxID=3986 RepID=UPI00215F135F|nr:putative E3 ubiquitin-protein ligase LIN-2 [Mercurialis annua]
MTSLHKLLTQEGYVHSKLFKGPKQAKFIDESITLPIYVCHDQTNLKTRSSSMFSSKRVGSDSGRTKSDELAIDQVAVKAVISILGGYIGSYAKDSSFRKKIRDKCNSCLIGRENDMDNRVFIDMESGMESVEMLVGEQCTSRNELSFKSLHKFFQNVASEISESTCGIPKSDISAIAQLYLSIIYKLEKNDLSSAMHLLQVFIDSPFLARNHLLPDLWQHLFLPHLLHLKIWYHKELETLSNSHKENRTKALSKAYNRQIDFGTMKFALYYREWLKVGGRAPSIPHVPLPSRPNSIPSRRRSSDSYSSYSSINRNLYQAVFGPTHEHQSVALNGKRRASMDDWVQTAEKLRIAEEHCKNFNYSSNKMTTPGRSSSQDHRISRNELLPERRKSSDRFMLFSCQSVVSECLVKGNHIIRNNSISHADYSTDQPMSDLSRAISTICLSDNLSDCEFSVRVIAKSWLESHDNPVIVKALATTSVIEGLLEVLFGSDDDEILELAISVLAEFVSKYDANRLIILNFDPQLEILMRLLKSSSLFLKAAALLYQLKPKAKQMISIDWVAIALRVLEFGDQVQVLFSVRCMPQNAALYFLSELLTGFSEDKNLENAGQVVALGGLMFLVTIIEKGDIDERNKGAMLMSCCIRADGSCRNYLAENVNKTCLLELIALGMQQKPNASAFTLLTDLLCLNKRKQIIEFLTQLQLGWGGLNAMHIFLVYLQRASPEERPLVGAILLHLDLLGDPLRSSTYREDAVEAIIEALDCEKCNSKVQDRSAKALLMLGSYFSYGSEATPQEWLLQHRSMDVFFSNHHVTHFNLNEEEKAIEEWQRKVAIMLLNSGSKKLVAALSNCIANGTPNLAQSCLFTVAWMNKVLHSVDQEISNYDTIYPSASLHHLIKSSECVSILSSLNRELIEPLRNRF